MDKFDRDTVIATFKRCAHDLRLKTYAQALKILKEKGYISSDELIDHGEEIQALWEQARHLQTPPSPPISRVDPTERRSPGGSVSIPEYDKEVNSTPIAIFVPHAINFVALDSKRCKGKESIITAAAVRQYGILKEDENTVILTWMFIGGYALNGVYRGRTRCRIVDSDVLSLQVDVLFGDEYVSELPPSPTSAPLPPTVLQPQVVAPLNQAVVPEQRISTECLPSGTSYERRQPFVSENTLAFLGQLNVHSALRLDSQQYTPSLAFPQTHLARAINGPSPFSTGMVGGLIPATGFAREVSQPMAHAHRDGAAVNRPSAYDSPSNNIRGNMIPFGSALQTGQQLDQGAIYPQYQATSPSDQQHHLRYAQHGHVPVMQHSNSIGNPYSYPHPHDPQYHSPSSAYAQPTPWAHPSHRVLSEMSQMPPAASAGGIPPNSSQMPIDNDVTRWVGSQSGREQAPEPQRAVPQQGSEGSNTEDGLRKDESRIRQQTPS